MQPTPLVSAVMIFLDARAFLAEAIESVLAQQYTSWELWLVDDGSTDGSSEIARRYAAGHPDCIFYLEHPGHVNRGMSASRNLGLRHARGEFVALLDADDVWLPGKLSHQVEVLTAHPEVGFLYGNTLYWHSWTGRAEDGARDFLPRLFSPGHPELSTDRVIRPPALVLGFLEGTAAVPTSCGLLVRRSVVQEVGGFEDEFRGMYEDQVFFCKLGLSSAAWVGAGHEERYRQHPRSSCSVAAGTGEIHAARLVFLHWLADYLVRQDIDDARLSAALRRNLWGYRRVLSLGLPPRPLRIVLLARKWLLRLEKTLLPSPLRRRLWRRRIARPERSRG
ncbi:MAG: glycosyltransferase family 2 protein [Candidatus Krumholzibacteriia bacterium]